MKSKGGQSRAPEDGRGTAAAEEAVKSDGGLWSGPKQGRPRESSKGCAHAKNARETRMRIGQDGKKQ